MKRVVLLLFCISPLLLSAQKVLIKGIARDTSKINSYVQITVNDTLTRFNQWVIKNGGWNSQTSAMYEKLSHDKNLVLNISGSGYFSIRADKKDTLYFKRVYYHTSKYAVKDLLKMKPLRIILKPEACIEYKPDVCPDSVPRKTYVFIGEKISVKPAPDPYYCNAISFDAESIAEYKVVQNIQGKFPGDTARFRVFVHSGPVFFDFKNVMLFVTDYCGKMTHEKYQFFEVYPTADNRWAFPGDPYRYDSQIKDKIIKPVYVEFKSDLWFDTKKYSIFNPQPVYTAPYYQIDETKAHPVMGTYPEDLLKIKKERVLKSVNFAQ